MVRCVNCQNLTRSTRKCSKYHDRNGNPVTLKTNEIHKQMSCPRYQAKWKIVLEPKNNKINITCGFMRGTEK